MLLIKYIKSIFLIFFLFILYKYPLNINKIKISKNIYNILKKINQFIIICRKGILLEKIKKSYKSPIITSIISLHNSANTIKSSIRSIQNQKTMLDLEIIVVEDCSTDNSYEILKELKNEDPRIKIIKNKINKGALYSKSIGALNAKGQYLLILDSDDLFINKNLFDICYKHSNNTIDIIEFSGFTSSKEIIETNKNPIIPYYLRFKKNNEIIMQPKLSSFIYEQNNNTIIKLIDGFIWGKFIKTEIYKKVLSFLGDWIYIEKINYSDDRIVNFALFQIANSFKFIEEYGIFYYNNTSSTVNSIKAIDKCHDDLINIMSIFNITKKTFDIKLVIFELISRWNITIYPGLNQNNKKYAKNLIKLILQFNFITKDDKTKIKLLLKDLI